MNESEPTLSHEAGPADHVSVAPPAPPVAENSNGDNSVLRPPQTSSPHHSNLMNMSALVRRPRVRRWLSNKWNKWLMAAAVVATVIGLSVGLATSRPGSPNNPVTGRNTASLGARGSNARSGPAAGGAAGTIGAISNSSFTITTSAGQSATITYSPSTRFEKGAKTISTNALTKGESVLILGATSNATISAAQVIVEIRGSSMFQASSTVVPFTHGSPTNLKQTGQIPADWTQGSGTIVGGTAADEATEAALAAYPGGVVDRVVLLGDGEYNVHYIGVNWPHHVFVNQDFKVVGAE
jgi:hypothetical protein